MAQNPRPRRKHTKASVIAAIRTAAKTCKGRRLSLHEFQRRTHINYIAIYRHFSSWEAATSAAGFTWPQYNKPVDSTVYLTDWGSIVRKLGRIPGQFEYKSGGNYHPATIARRCGGWERLPALFAEFAAGNPEWADVLALLPSPPSPNPAFKPRTLDRLPGRRTYGPPLNFDILRHAPVNEMGVIFLFALMAKQLGFIIESIHGAFPDCEAKRLVAEDEWQLRRIEFEYESKNFAIHQHPPEGCDIIVCWTHNWPEYPQHIEVIALSEAIKPLLE